MQIRSTSRSSVEALTKPLGRALALLLEASRYAEQTSGDPWEFAVEIQQLHALGLSVNDLRFLVRLRYIDHAVEVTPAVKNGRQFRRAGDLSFTRRTCFVLTPQGIVAVRNIPSDAKENESDGPTFLRMSANSNSDPEQRVPNWDALRRVLSFDRRIVKQYRWPAGNQEMVLSAFQEEGWPVRIDDPLPPHPTLDVKRRLSDTIKCLNRKQASRVLHFRGDGTGQGVLWEAVALSGPTRKPQ